jgi:acyl dehydratase
MPFPASAVGAEAEPIAHDLSLRAILAYAAGLGAVEPAFLDDAAPGGVRALPFLTAALEWPVLLSLRASLAGLGPTEAARSVHAVQDSIFHRPMRPGDQLATQGRLVAARRIRAGVLTMARLDTHCRKSGEAVTTTWSSSIYRDVALDGADMALVEPPGPPIDAGSAWPAAVESLRLPIGRGAAHVYTECSGIWNPIHTERSAALAAGLPDIILHGTATWALAGLAVLRRYADCDVGRLKRISGRFSGMIVPGEEITIRHAAAGRGSVRFEVLTALGATAISQGVAVVG